MVQKLICMTECKAVKERGAIPCKIEIDDCWAVTRVCIPLGDRDKANWVTACENHATFI